MYRGCISDRNCGKKWNPRLALWWWRWCHGWQGFYDWWFTSAGCLIEYSSISWALWSDATRGCSKNSSHCCFMVHVERAINKIKNFHISDGVTPLSLFPILNQMWTVCVFYVMSKIPFYHNSVSHFSILLKWCSWGLRVIVIFYLKGARGCVGGGALIDKQGDCLYKFSELLHTVALKFQNIYHSQGVLCPLSISAAAESIKCS